MLRIGITGGIGSGKSFVCHRIEALGYPVYDCDAEAKRLMVEDARLVQRIKRLIGENAYIDGVLNKPVVASFLFQSERNAKRLNALVHPVVLKDFVEWAKQQDAKLVFVESAILFQAKMETVCDRIWCVTAPLSVRLTRVMQRDGCDEQTVLSRIRQQMDDDEVLSRSHARIINDGTQDIDAQIKPLIQSLTL